MTRTRIGLTLGAFVLGLIAFSAVGYAQTGRIKGKVVDAQNKPVEGAQITMESKEMNRKLNTKTDKRGEYTQFLQPGTYMVTASKDNMSETFEVRVSIDEKEQNFSLKPGGGAAPARRRLTPSARRPKRKWPQSRALSSRASRSATKASSTKPWRSSTRSRRRYRSVSSAR